MTNPAATPEKIMTATRDAAPVVKGFRYAVTEVAHDRYRVRSLHQGESYMHTFSREVFGG